MDGHPKNSKTRYTLRQTVKPSINSQPAMRPKPLHQLGNGNKCGREGRGSEAGSYLRLVDSCITQLKAQGPSRTCNESKEEEQEEKGRALSQVAVYLPS